jgi:hypothetical protein
MSGDSRPYEPPLVEDLQADGPTVTAAGESEIVYTSITLVDSGGKRRIRKRGRRRQKASESAAD